jgi:hypothetical protein
MNCTKPGNSCQTDAALAVEMIAPHWPSEGRRNKAYCHLSGGLLRSGLPVERVETILEALAEATGDEEIAKRIEVVKPTAEKLKNGKPVTGWPKLAEAIGKDGGKIVAEFKSLLGLTITLSNFADAKRLPLDFLVMTERLSDQPEGGIGIPYRDATGMEIAVKKRKTLATNSYRWPKGQKVLAYGEHRLEDAVKGGYQVIVEGESDCLTLWYHGEPALGLPGADTVNKTLEIGHVASVQKIYVVQEPDAGGEVFLDAVRRRLGALGWQGELYRVFLEDSKDPSALRCDDPERFKERWRAALEKADTLEVGIPATAAPSLPANSPWPVALAPEAFYGLAGEIVRALEPSSEADPAAMLIQIVVGFGNILGRTAHAVVEADKHFGNEFVVLAGKTSKGRKGTSWGRINRLLNAAEKEWANDRIQTGLSSGEGLIWAVRDPVEKMERVKERGEPVRYEKVEADPGVSDKRLLVVEPEYANVLKQTERQGNTLSAILRQSWESGDLRTLTKNSPARATGAHVSLLGHITTEELRRYLTTTEMANGFGNRHLWICVRRSKELPDGGSVDEAVLAELQTRLADAVAFGRGQGAMYRDEAAREMWREVYGQLSADRPGLSGALLGRAEAHVLRLSMIYALLDCSPAIGATHLLAALALWDYAEASVKHIWGDALGDPVADELLRLLRASPDGITRNQMCDSFGRHQSSERIGKALALLAEHRLARSEHQETGGRPREVWRAMGKRPFLA